MDWSEITPLLHEKLDPKNVKKPSGPFGPKGDYIEGWHAIAEANRIFGHGSWSYEIKNLSKDSLELVTLKKKDRDGNEYEEKQWQAAYTCLVRVTVSDVVREDVGFGSGFSKQIGDAIEGATKEAVTDALKRALRTFGNPFGLALYDKSRENVGTNEPPFSAPAAAQRIKDKLRKCKTLEQLGEAFKAEWSVIQEIGQHDSGLRAQIVNLKDQLKADLHADPARNAPPLEGGHSYQ